MNWRCGLVGLCLVGLAGAIGCEHHTTPVEYQIADGYTGWVTVRYHVPGAAPLPRANGSLLARIPKTGVLETSTEQEFGVLHRTFFYMDDHGTKKPLENADDRDTESKAATTTFPAPVVCCGYYGKKSVSGVSVPFSGFYVGRGPAGQAP